MFGSHFLIWIAVYALLVRFLLDNPTFKELVSPFYRLQPGTHAIIGGVAVIGGIAAILACLWLKRRATNRSLDLVIFAALNALVGLYCAGLYHLFQFSIGQYPEIEFFIIFPLSSVIAVIIGQILDRSGSEFEFADGFFRRLLIWPAVFGFVFFVFANQPDIQRLVEPLETLHPTVRTWVSVSVLALLVGAAIARAKLFRSWLSIPPWAEIWQFWRTRLALNFTAGLMFAAAMNVFFAFTSNYGIDLVSLLIVPLGFAAACGVEMLFAYRIQRGPLSAR